MTAGLQNFWILMGYRHDSSRFNFFYMWRIKAHRVLGRGINAFSFVLAGCIYPLVWLKTYTQLRRACSSTKNCGFC